MSRCWILSNTFFCPHCSSFVRSCVHFGEGPFFLVLQDVPGSSCIFFFCLSPRISYFSKEPGSFYWKMILRDQDLGPGARFTFPKRTQIPELPTCREVSRCLAQHHVGACLLRPQCPAHNSSVHTCLYFFKSFQSAGLRH